VITLEWQVPKQTLTSFCGGVSNLFENGTEYLSIHSLIPFDQWIACFLNAVELYLEVEGTGLFYDVLLTKS